MLRAIASAMGDYASVADFGTFLSRDKNATGPRNDVATLAGKRLVISVEVDPGQRLAEALIKQLTGGDKSRARFLYKESFEFLPTFKIWLAANDRPYVRDDDGAMWRRILQVPFNSQIPEADRNKLLKPYLETAGRARSNIRSYLDERRRVPHRYGWHRRYWLALVHGGPVLIVLS